MTHDLSHLPDLVAASFAPDGFLAQVLAEEGRRFMPTPEQLSYAAHMAKILSMDSPNQGASGHVSMVEAETGVGKTLGYLIPLVMRVALTGERAAVSTYTNLLANQIEKEDGITAAAVVKRATGKEVNIKTRIGRKNFINYERIKKLVAALDDADAGTPAARRRDELDTWLDVPEDQRPMTFPEAVEYGLIIPDGVDKSDICVLKTSTLEAKKHYLAHAAASSGADVVITNHSITLLHARGMRIIGEVDLIVADEADAIPAAAESLSSQKLSLFETVKFLENIDQANLPLSPAIDAVSDLWTCLSKMNIDDPQVVNPDHEEFATLLSLSRKMLAEIENLHNKVTDEEDKDELSSIKHDLETWIGGVVGKVGYITPMISASPVKAYPSLVYYSHNPARVMKNLWRVPEKKKGGDQANDAAMDEDDRPAPRVENIILTSATLSSSSDGPVSRYEDRKRMFEDLVKTLGLTATLESDPEADSVQDRLRSENSASFGPSSFGKMKFVLADRAAPRPTRPKVATPDEAQADGDDVDESQFDTDPKWLDYAASGIIAADRAAQASGDPNKRTLVLTASYDDASELEDRLLYDADLRGRLLVQHRGDSAQNLIQAYKARPDAIMILPGAWSGLNLPGMVHNLVIPRVPFSPPNNEAEAGLRHWLRTAQGLNPEKAAGRAAGTMFNRNMNRMKRKLRQGIGRGLRRADDRCTLWILDPRFPLPEVLAANPWKSRYGQGAAAVHNGLAACIPKRFRGGLGRIDDQTFDQAAIHPFAAQ